MDRQSLFTLATGGHLEVPADWMPASRVQPLIFEDPALLWLEYYGVQFGFQPDTSPYDLGSFLSEKGREFERRWMREMAPEAVRVCGKESPHPLPEDGRTLSQGARGEEDPHPLPADGHLLSQGARGEEPPHPLFEDGHILSQGARVEQAQAVAETLRLMAQGVPVIAQPALWWAPEKIYGVPDLIAQASWVRARFPDLVEQEVVQGSNYVVLDLKFTTKIDESGKSKDRLAYAAQVRLYSYMLGQLQGHMPAFAYLITRDRIANPFPIPITAALGQPLEADLGALRDQFIEIKLNGRRYRPWRDALVESNPGNPDERWRTAKRRIASEFTPGGDLRLVYQIGQLAGQELRRLGYPSLEALLQAEPEALPLESLKGIGAGKARQIRAVLQANRAGRPVLPPAELVPRRRLYEFFVDFEYFVNINVDFERQWPDLQGREMIFMIGMGWMDPGQAPASGSPRSTLEGRAGQWHFESLEARAEEPAAEAALFERFLALLRAKTGGAIHDPEQAALYHWTGAEVWQTQRAADRQGLTADHPLRSLPWSDLQKVFLNGYASLPGALSYGLKEFAAALGAYDPAYATHWPDELDQGLNAMVMGWQAYRQPDPLHTVEFSHLRRYLEQDCAALERLLAWVRG